MAMSFNSRDRRRGPRPVLQAWLDDEKDSVQKCFAISTEYPNTGQPNDVDYHFGAPSTALTSQLDNGATGITSMNSLPGLSRGSTSGNLDSIATSVVAIDAEQRQRLLAPDWSQAGVLTVNPVLMAPVSLECPFKTILSCPEEFEFHDRHSWIIHSFKHFERHGDTVEPPKTNKCCFCNEKFLRDTGVESWTIRMEHIRQSHHANGWRLATGRPDFELAQYLWGAEVIDGATFRHWAAKQSIHSPPSSPEGQHPAPVTYRGEGRRSGRGRQS